MYSNLKYIKYHYRTTCTIVNRDDNAESGENPYLKNLWDNNKMAPEVLPFVSNDLTKKAFSPKRLLVAYSEIKYQNKRVAQKIENVILPRVNKNWFKKISISLIDGSFKCPETRKIYIPNTTIKSICPIILIPLGLKIIEKSILNAIQPVFEGKYNWIKIKKSRYEELCKKFKTTKNLRVNKSGYFYKH